MTGYEPGLMVLLAVTAVLVWPSRRATGALAPGCVDRGGRSLPASLASAGRLGRRWRPGPGGGTEPEALADLLEVIVPALRAGASEAAAVAMACRAVATDDPRSGPFEGSRSPTGGSTDGRLRGPLAGLVEELSCAARRGESLATVWARAASASGSPGAGFVARAWALSEETGVPLSLALETAARSLRAQEAAARALSASIAGARASMVLLALLPAAGPAIGLLFGLTPLDLYGGSPAASLCLVVGAVLGLTGWLWSRAIVGRALRPSTVGDGR